ncbi:class I SAM-dependent methyltransferase [Bacillus sp. JRC01]|nr:class I SAM-dependent methyltransferase [Bacillus sp. JRC01]
MSVLQKQFKEPSGPLGWLAGKIMEFDNRRIHHWSLKRLGIQNGDRVLEIGYGTGSCIESIAASYPHASVDGIDISETMEETAKKKNEKAIHEGRVRLWNGDIGDFSSDTSYDKIFAINNYPLWNDQEKSLARIYSLLHEGGTLLITVQPRGDEASDERAKEYGEEIAAAVRSTGFKDVSISYKKGSPAMTASVTCKKTG